MILYLCRDKIGIVEIGILLDQIPIRIICIRGPPYGRIKEIMIKVLVNLSGFPRIIWNK